MRNQVELVKDIADGMIGIAGIPSNQEFYTEFNDRVKRALNISDETDTEKLCRFFKFFRDNGEKMIGLSIEQFVDEFLKQDKK